MLTEHLICASTVLGTDHRTATGIQNTGLMSLKGELSIQLLPLYFHPPIL